MGVERYSHGGRVLTPSKPEYRARYPDARPIFRDANTGAGQDFTGLAAAVQLRLRVAFGLQTLIVTSRLLTGGAHGTNPTVGTDGLAQAPACSSKRTVRLISGIALDECQVRERYPARRPFCISEREAAQATSFISRHEPVEETGRGCLLV
jgi:hypothetical protein